MHRVQFKVEGTCSVRDIPPQPHVAPLGTRDNSSGLKEVSDKVRDMLKGQVLMVKHNALSSGAVHARLFSRLVASDGYKVKINVRGDTAYVTKVG